MVKPILEENKRIYEACYLGNNPESWANFEPKIVVNNTQLKLLLKKNMDLFQENKNSEYRNNKDIIQDCLLHVDEFQMTRGNKEKHRVFLFPEEVNSIFGVAPLMDELFNSLESLECLIGKYKKAGIFINVVLDGDEPHVEYVEEGENIKVFLEDSARLRQLYKNNGCFRPRSKSVQLKQLIYRLQWLKDKGHCYTIPNEEKLPEICINGYNITFVYKYCLNRADVESLPYQKNLHIVNLHWWNGDGCIADEARGIAQDLGYELYTQTEFLSNCDRGKWGTKSNPF